MKLSHEMETYIRNSLPELMQLIRDLCAIPAPTGHEEVRAAFCRDWFIQNGAENVMIDDALNVICTLNAESADGLAVFMAHTDTVFPDMQPLPFSEEGGKMFCPGITDDTANLAVMMICARYFIQNRIPTRTGMLFAANSCEEGLGNLKGSRQIMADYGGKIRELITMDGSDLRSVVTEAVGSHRYRVTVRTEGGHSFGSFGNSNAIHRLSQIISALYTIRVPESGGSKTTYNVGMISGGTSVNTIAQQAEMLYEYRSDHLECLRQMENMFFGVIESFRRSGVDIEVEKIGDRPCSGPVDPQARQALINMACASIREVLDLEPVLSSGSTDANTALAAGIPAICISVCNGGGCHTRSEWLDADSLQDGCRLLMDILGKYAAQ